MGKKCVELYWRGEGRIEPFFISGIFCQVWAKKIKKTWRWLVFFICCFKKFYFFGYEKKSVKLYGGVLISIDLKKNNNTKYVKKFKFTIYLLWLGIRHIWILVIFFAIYSWSKKLNHILTHFAFSEFSWRHISCLKLYRFLFWLNKKPAKDLCFLCPPP